MFISSGWETARTMLRTQLDVGFHREPKLRSLTVGYRALYPSRGSRNQHAVRNYSARRDDRADRDDTVLTDHDAIKEGGTNPDQTARPDRCAVHHRSLPDRHVIADLQRHVEIRVQDRAILHVDALSQSDRRKIAADGSVGHNGTVIPQDHIASDIGRRRDVNALTYYNLRMFRIHRSIIRTVRRG